MNHRKLKWFEVGLGNTHQTHTVPHTSSVNWLDCATVPPVERLCKISVFATPLRILHAYGVASETRELVNLPDNVLVTGSVYKILVRMPLASFCGILEELRSSLEV
jgi:hypothetical protein